MAMRTVEVLLEPEMHQQIKDRAKARGCSANEWMRLALGHALSGPSAAVVVTSTVRRDL